MTFSSGQQGLLALRLAEEASAFHPLQTLRIVDSSRTA
jgi:hypothetical protein